MHLPSFNCLGIRSGVEFIPINIFCVSCFETKMFVFLTRQYLAMMMFVVGHLQEVNFYRPRQLPYKTVTVSISAQLRNHTKKNHHGPLLPDQPADGHWREREAHMLPALPVRSARSPEAPKITGGGRLVLPGQENNEIRWSRSLAAPHDQFPTAGSPARAARTDPALPARI